MLGAGMEKGWTTGVAAYEAVRAMAEDNLSRGMPVVVDAVNDSEAARDTWRRAASSTGTTVTFVLLTLSDPKEHRRRLEGRQRGMINLAEPAWDDVRAREQVFEPWVGPCIEVDAGLTLHEIIAAVLGALD